ncbi:MAG: allantoicase [Planctomycetes bacterium]|nr:allantoicase [Planctomycetota bacterium]
MSSATPEAAAFSGLVDLAQEKLGGRALAASDEFFAEKENLLKPGRGVFLPDKYTDRGKWMDGWESRRKRVPGHDWCILRLGLAGVLRGVDIDTNHFLGNHPPYASLDACEAAADATAEALAAQATAWTELLPKSPLRPGSQNLFAISSDRRWTHLRLNIFPDGGVARLRAYGRVAADAAAAAPGQLVDLAAIVNGGVAVAANDMFFGHVENMLMPGRGANMGDGWETRRKRQPGHDWAIVKLARAGEPRRLEVDTAFFKGNFPDTCSVDGCFSPDREIDALTWTAAEWKELLPKSKLGADRVHPFEKELRATGPLTHVRLNIHPDGGVSRFRVYCVPAGGR